MKKFLFLFSFCSLLSTLCSQNYFQQEVNYRIKVTLDDKKHELSGEETIEYINHSPDELSFIWFHLWPNAYKNNRTALGKQLFEEGNLKYYFASQEERGWIDNLDFKVDGQSIKIEKHPEHIDICKIVLNHPIKAGEKIIISTPFRVHIPLGVFSRLGHIGQQYQITQWYPKPAVYDKYGWHPIPYLNQGEFYSEFGSFDVSITLPRNYVVGATGTLVNGEEETEWLLKKVEETKLKERFNRIDTAFPPSSSEMKTLRYQASDVHDFAWFADKRYHVLHDEVTLPHTKQKVDTWVMFTNLYGEYWKKAIKYVNDAVYYYSLWNGDYPYPHATAVDGALGAGGGMEYPMITVIGGIGNDETLDRVITHEVGHNWFYGILGSNERDHAWMDEGVNSFNENRYMKTKYSPDSARISATAKVAGVNVNIGELLGMTNLDESTLFDLAYRFNAVKKMDQPVDLTSAEYTTINYGTVVYGKTATILAYLQAYLGEEVYDKCAQKYFERWKFKHPYPDDMKKVYEEISGKNLSWFFDELIKTTKQIDYKICNTFPSFSSEKSPADKREGDKKILSYEVRVKNKGAITSPFSISAIQNGKIISTQWHDGFPRKRRVSLPLPALPGEEIRVDLLKIDAENKMPDMNRQNNNLKKKGLCKRTEPFNLRMLGLIHNTDKTQLFWLPVMGWNNYNKFMLGAAVYNNLIPEKKLEWVLMPMYGFGNKDLAGGASIHYNIHPALIFQTIRLGINAERYCYRNDVVEGFNNNKSVNLNFNKLAPQLYLEIKKKRMRSSLKQSILARHINITKEILTSLSPPFVLSYRYDSSFTAINDITYRIANSRPIHPYSVSLNVQQSRVLGMKSSVTANYHITFKPFVKERKQKRKGLDIRIFAGKFLDGKNLSDGNYFFYSSAATGTHDYLYDNIFLGRSETDGFFSHQFALAEGGMKVSTPLGRTRDWLGAINLDCSLPGKIPFTLFADFSFFSKDLMSTVGKDNQYSLYTFGIHIPIVKSIIDVYVPLLMSSDIKNTFYLNNPDLESPTAENPDPDRWKRTWRMIRFTFNIHSLNPFEAVRNLSF